MLNLFTNYFYFSYRKVKINDTFRKTAAEFPKFEYLESMVHVFKYLKTHDLLSAARVCTSWNFIAMKSIFVSFLL